jgi:ribonuclease HII
MGDTRLNLDELHRRHVVEGRPLPRALEVALRADSRAGARRLLAAVERRRRDNRAEGQRLRTMLRFETGLWQQGYARIAGVDEAGMSPLAGPVVAAAVILPPGARLPGVDDSKKLSAAQREQLVIEIEGTALAFGVGRAEPEEIDRINIYRAGLLAMRRAVEGLAPGPDYLLIDARSLKELGLPQQGIIRGDQQSLSIAAASIVAKTRRDAWMCELDARYPGYGLAQHKGYPVAQHLRALSALGVTPIHRRSFAPVKQALGLVPEQQDLF